MFLIHVKKSNLQMLAEPALDVRAADGSFHKLAKTVEMLGPARVCQAYEGEEPPIPGIRAWVETEGPIVVDGERVGL